MHEYGSIDIENDGIVDRPPGPAVILAEPAARSRFRPIALFALFFHFKQQHMPALPEPPEATFTGDVGDGAAAVELDQTGQR